MHMATALPYDDDPLESHRERAERHMQTLRELTELAMGLARTQAQKARDAAEAETPPVGRDPALVFAQVARAVRQSIALEARIGERLRTAEAETLDGAAALRQAAAGAAQRLKEKLKDFIIRDPGPPEGLGERFEGLERERFEGERLEVLDKAQALRELGFEDEPSAGPLHHAAHGPPPPMGEEWVPNREASVPPPLGEGDRLEGGGGGSPPPWRSG
ncbi:hypothetical protein [Phenylobacterium montanum]|uniref:Uncharacterized protein n=1 Tax=Phenylobacterium montanum TaxID=2823693 RepID=A0A975ITF8_9CAUL|nr:hypothetical protein [Caulobacter sp. S6]QUD86822.1 hypothetical protein KCG34_17315 [Caulobacter sp. S6]